MSQSLRMNFQDRRLKAGNLGSDTLLSLAAYDLSPASRTTLRFSGNAPRLTSRTCP
jgi:hypothetical protein